MQYTVNDSTQMTAIYVNLYELEWTNLTWIIALGYPEHIWTMMLAVLHVFRYSRTFDTMAAFLQTAETQDLLLYYRWKDTM